MMMWRLSASPRWLSLGAAALLLSALTACVNPNAIGVQDTGEIVGTVYDTKTSQPMANVLVHVGSLTTGRTDTNGHFDLRNVPVGPQPLSVVPPGGYSAPPQQTVDVQKGQTISVPAIGLTAG